MNYDNTSSKLNRNYWQKLKILTERASRDFLSGLLNRETATLYIENYLKTMPKNDICALFIIDLDNFKQVNDSLGHQAGDQVIHQAARMLSNCFRVTDIVGRLGGDEFFALLSGKVTKELIREKAQNICELLQFSIGSPAELRITASVGVHIATGPVSFKTLYARADSALYEAKASGKNCFQIDDGEKIQKRAKQTEKKIVQLPIHLHTLLAYMDEGISLLEVSDTIRMRYASPAFCKMMNIEDGHGIFPCTLSALDKIHPDDVEEYEKLLREGIKNGKSLEYEYRFTPNGKDWRWCRVKAVRVPTFDSGSPTMLALSSDISAIKNTENFSFENREKLKLVFGQRNQFLWEVNIPTRTFRLFNFRQHLRNPGICIENFPDSLIAKGWVHPISVAKFKEFAEELLGGNAAGGGAFALRHKMSKNYGWFSVFYRMLPDKGDRAAKVIGIVEALADMDPQKTMLGKERMWEALRPNLFLYLQANISIDKVESAWIEGRNLTKSFRRVSYQKLLEQNKSRLFFKEDIKNFFQLFGREELIAAFNKGHTWLTKEYRCVDDGGNIRWFSYTAVLSMIPQTRHIRAFIFVQNTEHRHAREKGWKNVRYVPATGLYDRETARALAEHAVKTEKSSLHTLALVRIVGGCASLSDKKETEQQKRHLIVMAFSLLLGSDCVIGELGEDKITIFRPDAVSRIRTRQKIDEAFAFVRYALSDTIMADSLRFVAAVICENLHDFDYEGLLSEAESICDTWKSAPEDSVVFFSKKTDRSLKKYRHNALDTSLAKKVEPCPPNRQEDIVLDCLDAMIMANSTDTALSMTLSRIGRHYGADRVYTLALTENEQSVILIHEWFIEEKSSIKQFISGTRLERLPLLKSCLEKQEPAFINKKTPSTSGGNAASRNWNYGVFPLHSETDGTPKGFLCLENPAKGVDDMAQIKRLLPYIVHLHKRYSISVEGQDAALQDALTGLSNLHSYRNKVYLLASDNYSSMGVLALDIPQFAPGSDGTESAAYAKTLLHVSEVLTSIFGKSFIFRTRNAEFTVFCPNTTQDVFLARILRTQSILQRRYPKALRFGHTWAEGLFSGEKLAKEARAIMLCGDLDPPSFETARLDTSNMEWQKHFVMYLQPKVNMRTGFAFSAEALVRGVDDKGRIVSPKRFIEAMEKAGTIKELDFFMLHQALSFMEDWRRQGLKLIPISVNFSRFTLLSSSAPGSVLAILSRYPSISPDWLELEITETAGNVEKSTFERIMDNFRAFGLHFALDDFGSRYANLSVFTNVRFDTVKLDQSLIRELSYNAICRSLVGDIVRICNNQGIQCVAEGVETQAQVDTLLEEGCTYAQGFYYDQPMPIQEFKEKYMERIA